MTSPRRRRTGSAIVRAVRGAIAQEPIAALGIAATAVSALGGLAGYLDLESNQVLSRGRLNSLETWTRSAVESLRGAAYSRNGGDAYGPYGPYSGGSSPYGGSYYGGTAYPYGAPSSYGAPASYSAPASPGSGSDYDYGRPGWASSPSWSEQANSGCGDVVTERIEIGRVLADALDRSRDGAYPTARADDVADRERDGAAGSEGEGSEAERRLEILERELRGYARSLLRGALPRDETGGRVA